MYINFGTSRARIITIKFEDKIRLEIKKTKNKDFLLFYTLFMKQKLFLEINYF
jgi:hypothetical protein